MTPEQREWVARAEAKLRGGKAYWFVVDNGPAKGEGFWLQSANGSNPSLDPTTAPGAIGWMELAANDARKQFPDSDIRWVFGRFARWEVRLEEDYLVSGYSVAEDLAEGQGDSLLEAITAAVIAYAERCEK